MEVLKTRTAKTPLNSGVGVGRVWRTQACLSLLNDKFCERLRGPSIQTWAEVFSTAVFSDERMGPIMMPGTGRCARAPHSEP
jgi:hypothetical protein